MGLFGSNSVVQRSSTVMRMIPDRDIKPAAKMAVFSYISSADSDTAKVSAKSLADYMSEASANSSIPKFKQLARWASQGHYSYGDLTSSFISPKNTDISGIVSTVLTAREGKPITLAYATFGLNLLHITFKKLIDDYGYNLNTNISSVESTVKDQDVYLEDIVLVSSEDIMLNSDSNMYDLLGLSAMTGKTPFRPHSVLRPHTPVELDDTLVNPYARVTWVHSVEGVKTTYTTLITFEDYLPDNTLVDGEPIDVDYTQYPNVGVDFVMANYKVEGVIKQFNYMYGIGDIPEIDGMFLATSQTGNYVPRIYARINGARTNAAHLKDTARYKDSVKAAKKLGFGWSQWVDEAHSSIDEPSAVRDMYIQTGVCATDFDPVNCQYLFHYFSNLYAQLGTAASRGIRINVSDRVMRSGFVAKSLSVNLRTGVKTTVGSYTGSRTNTRVSLGLRATYRNNFVYYHQVTDSTYYEVVVGGLDVFSTISGDGEEWSDEGSDLIIPLDLSTKARLSGAKLERLYAKSLHIVCNVYKKTKKKWYQTGIFKVIMFIIAVVVTIFFPPAAFAGYGLMALTFAAVVLVVAVSLVIQLVVKLLLAVGVDGAAMQAIATIIAIVAIMYGGYLGLSGTSGAYGVTAQTMMNISSQAFSIANQGRALQLQDMIKEYQKTMDTNADKLERLEEMVATLGLHYTQDASIFLLEKPVTLDIRIGEYPEDYYARSIHAPNIGTAVYDYLESYVDLNLQLPNINSLSYRMEQLTNERV